MNQRSAKQSAPRLFASDPDVFQNAHLDRVPMPWGLYIDGYLRAAELLATCPKTFYDGNTLIYPVVFLYRQYVELSLKEFIIQANQVVERPHPFPMHHNLSVLWDICNRIVQERGLPVSKDDLHLIKRYIDDFNRFDSTSDAFRYPVTKKRTPSIPKPARLLSLQGLAAAMTRFSHAFRELSGLLDADVDLQEEFEHDVYGSES